MNDVEQPPIFLAEFVTYASREAMVFVAAIAFSMIGLGLHMLGFLGMPSLPGIPQSLDAKTMYWLLVILGVLGALLAAVRLVKPREELRLGAQGFYWSRWSDKRIPWSEIERVSMRDINTGRFVVLHLRDSRAFPPRRTVQILGYADRHFLGGDIWVPLAGMVCSYTEILAAFETHVGKLKLD